MSDETPDDTNRIAKVLARAGVCSRRAAEKLIAEGRVAVNGVVLHTPAVLVGPGDEVSVDGAPLKPPEHTRLWRYHKPPGLVTTHHDPQGRPTVVERLPRELPRVRILRALEDQPVREEHPRRRGVQDAFCAPLIPEGHQKCRAPSVHHEHVREVPIPSCESVLADRKHYRVSGGSQTSCRCLMGAHSVPLQPPVALLSRDVGPMTARGCGRYLLGTIRPKEPTDGAPRGCHRWPSVLLCSSRGTLSRP